MFCVKADPLVLESNAIVQQKRYTALLQHKYTIREESCYLVVVKLLSYSIFMLASECIAPLLCARV